MLGTSNNTDVLHYLVHTALRTNSLSLECPSLQEEVISPSCQVSFQSVQSMDLTCSKLGIRCTCDTSLGPVQGDSCSSCHHFAEFGECWWATAGAAPAVCSYLQELGHLAA